VPPFLLQKTEVAKKDFSDSSQNGKVDTQTPVGIC